MDVSKTELQIQLDFELFRKGVAPSVVFLSLGALLISLSISISQESLVYINVAVGVGLILSNLLRLRLVHIFLKKGKRYKKIILTYKLLIVINSLLLASMYYFNLKFGRVGDNLYHILPLFSGALAGASMLTLGANFFLTLIFILCNGLPGLFHYSYLFLQDQENRLHLSYMMMHVIFLVYVIKQLFDYHKQLKKRIETEIKLITANNDLINSNEKLFQETLKSQYAARLASLGEVTGGVAHEINNPLAVIKLNLELLNQMTNDVQTKDVLNGSVQKIQASVNRISDVIKSMRLLAGEDLGDPITICDLNTLIQDAVALVQEKLRQVGIQLKFKLKEDVQIKCKAPQIMQIILNLVNNAVDVLERVNEEKVIAIYSVEDRGLINIYVSNSGPKISSDIKDKLFQPFFTTKPVGKGMGLSLSVSRGIALEHEGDLRLESQGELGKFTTFNLVLPVYKNAA